MTEETAPPAAKRSRRNRSGRSGTADHEPMISRIPNINATALQDTSNWCSKTFGALLEDSSTHDIVFKTSDGGSVGAHRAIVAAGSPVFRAMLYGNMRESSQKEIDLPTTDTETLNKLLTFLYTGKVDVDSDCIVQILVTAHYFDIALLETMLVDFIKNSLGIVNVFPIVAIAIRQKFDQLFEHCLEFMCDHADEVVQHESFKSVSSEIILLLCKSSEFRIKELNLFLAVVEWYKHNQDQVPETVVKSIFQEIRYPLIPKSDLVNTVRPTKMADPSLYTAALEYYLFPDKYEGPQSQIIHRKCPSQDSLFINVTPLYMDVTKTSDGVIISRYGNSRFRAWGLCIAQVYPTERQHIQFKVIVKCISGNRNIHLVTRSFEVDDPTIPVGSVTDGINIATFIPQCEVNGTVSIRGNYIFTTLSGISRATPRQRVVYLCIHMCNPGDEIQFSLT